MFFFCSFFFFNLLNPASLFVSSSIPTQESAADFFDDIEQIKSQSLLLKAEQDNLSSVKANLFSKKMAWTPTLTGTLGRQKNSSNPSSSVSNQDLDYWSAKANWNLFNGGGDLHAHSAALSTQEAQEFKILDENLKLEGQSATLIFHELYLQDVIKSTQELVRLREESHRIVQEKYKLGKSPLQEVMKSEVDQKQQQIRLRNLQIQQLENQVQWKTKLATKLRTKSWPFSKDQKIPTLSREHSPEVNVLSKQTKASEELWKTARSQHWPKLDLTAQYQESPLNKRDFSEWSTGIAITIPIWSQYEHSAKIAAAYSDLSSSRHQFEESLRKEEAQREILNGKSLLAQKNLTDAKINVEKSAQLYKDMLTSFRYGRLSMNELLIEQNRLIESELGLSQSQWDFHKILIESCAVAGLPAKSCLTTSKSGI